jgi:site-specific recombinase XerD
MNPARTRTSEPQLLASVEANKQCIQARVTRSVQGATTEWVFPSPRKKGSHISYFPVAKQFSKTRAKAGLPDDIVLYSARHSFATDMLDRTGNIVLVQKMLAHESVTTTQRYLHPELKDMAQLVNQRNADADENLRHSGERIQ